MTNLKLLVGRTTKGIHELPDPLGEGVSEAIDALVIVACDVEVSAVLRERTHDLQFTSVQVLILVHDDVSKVALQPELGALVQGAFHAVNEFGAQRVAENRPVLAPRSEKRGIRELGLPFLRVGVECFPVSGQHLERVPYLSYRALENDLQVLLYDVALVEVIGDEDRFDHIGCTAVPQKLPERKRVQGESHGRSHPQLLQSVP